MTAVDDRPVAEDRARGLGISRLLGRGCFDVVAAPAGLDHEVRGVTIWDQGVPEAVAVGDVVLVPVPELTELLADQVLAVAAGADAAAVVVKAPGDLSWLQRRGDRHGVAVLVAAPELPWDDVFVLARSLAPADRLDRAVGRPAVTDLYELAEAAAFLLDGPVSITDAELRPLAFANLGHPVDQLRAASIMARRTPDDARAWLENSGTWARLRNSRAPLIVEIPGAAQRAIAPVVARDAVVGYVCLAAGVPGWTADLDKLSDVAAAAATFCLPTRGTDEDQLSADLLRGTLRGSGSLAALARHLGEAGQWCLTTIAAGAAATLNSTFEDDHALAAYARLLRRGSAATALEGRVYLLTPFWGESDAVALADRMRRRAGTLFGLEFAACVSDSLPPTSELTAVRPSLDRAVARLAAQPQLRTALLSEVRSETVLAELGEIVKGNPVLMDGVLDVLRTGSARDTDYLNTLRAYFDAGCDVSEAAKRLQIHRNTLRYRLQRIEEICGVDLGDPAQRFLVELHTRLLPIS